jgi:hypothetical protein
MVMQVKVFFLPANCAPSELFLTLNCSTDQACVCTQGEGVLAALYSQQRLVTCALHVKGWSDNTNKIVMCYTGMTTTAPGTVAQHHWQWPMGPMLPGPCGNSQYV